MAAKPTELKKAENRGLFDEEGPEQTSLFFREGLPVEIVPRWGGPIDIARIDCFAVDAASRPAS
jgi:hypothetical protein